MPQLVPGWNCGVYRGARRTGGAGLGLSIRKRLARLMGGVIRIGSEYGAGGGFSACPPFPVAARARADPALAACPAPGHAHALVVEDNATNQKIAEAMLGKLGVRASVAGNGREALDMLGKTPCDLILMDCQMPVMDGYEATRRIRRGEAGARQAGIRIIAMTASAMSGDREKCLAAGMDDYLAKPILIEQLAMRLARWLPARALTTGDAAQPRMAEARGAARPQPALLDEQALLVNSAGDRILAKEIVALAIAGMSQYLDQLDQSLAQAQWPAALRAAHTMKGLLAQVGGKTLSARLKEVELALREGGAIDPALARDIREECGRLVGELEQWRSG